MIDIEHKLCNTLDEFRAGRAKRRDFVKTLQRRLDYLSERADNRGVKSGYASAEMGALRHALNCVKAEYAEYLDANRPFLGQAEAKKQND